MTMRSFRYFPATIIDGPRYWMTSGHLLYITVIGVSGGAEYFATKEKGNCSMNIGYVEIQIMWQTKDKRPILQKSPVADNNKSYECNLMFFWSWIMNWLYINYHLDALTTIHSQNTILLHTFRASSAHLQEDTAVYMQHMAPSLSVRVPGGLPIRS